VAGSACLLGSATTKGAAGHSRRVRASSLRSEPKMLLFATEQLPASEPKDLPHGTAQICRLKARWRSAARGRARQSSRIVIADAAMSGAAMGTVNRPV
jgi:hypothetical protein